MDLQYLDNLDIFINDENKIVTYRWLSLTLSVSSNMAKQMLYHYLQKSKDSNKECKLSVTYLLSGIQFDEELKQDVHKICVVREDDLEKLKSTFKTIYSLHIYSLQKVQIKDLNILYGIDYDNIKEDVFQSAQYSSFSPSSKFRSNVQTKQEIPATCPKKNMEFREHLLCEQSMVETDIADENELNEIENLEVVPSQSSENEPPRKKMRKRGNEISTLNTMMEDVYSSLKSIQANRIKKDECDAFAEFIACRLKKLDEKTRAATINKVGKILFEVEMDRIKHNSLHQNKLKCIIVPKQTIASTTPTMQTHINSQSATECVEIDLPSPQSTSSFRLPPGPHSY